MELRLSTGFFRAGCCYIDRLLKFLGVLLRVYSYVCEAALCLAALAFSAVVIGSPHQQVTVGWLPWTGEALGAWLAVIAIAGLLTVVLAAAGRARILLTLFALGVFVLITRGLFFTAWRFSGAEQARQALWLSVGLFFAFIGAIPARRRSDAYRVARSR